MKFDINKQALIGIYYKTIEEAKKALDEDFQRKEKIILQFKNGCLVTSKTNYEKNN